MPETGEEPDDKEVEDLVFSVSSERNIYIVTEESAEGHMPSAPEFRCGTCNIGIVEVFEEMEAENFSETYCHIGIAGEIVIDLDREHKNAEPDRSCASCRKVAGKIGFGKLAGNVCDKDLFCKTNKESCGSAPDILEAFAAVVNFKGNVRISYYRTRNELGIERNIHEEFHIVMLGFNVAFININSIAEGLEGIEAYTDRKREFRNRNIKSGEEIDILHEKSAVFENSEKAEVENKRRDKRKFCADFSAVFFNNTAMEIVDGRTENKKGYPNRLAPGIKKERKENKNRVSERSVFCAEIEQDINRQEKIEEK